MAYLIDTDILIYSIKGHTIVQKHFVQNGNVPKAISVVSYGELVYGAKKSEYIEKNLAVVHRIAEIYRIIDITKAVMETFGGLKAQLQRDGITIADMDLLIASSALTLNLSLVTNNEKHFSKIPGLTMENWTR